MRVLFIDPGTVQSAYADWIDESNQRVLRAEILENSAMRDFLSTRAPDYFAIGIEKIESYGRPVGAETFETCVWCGRFAEAVRQRIGSEPHFPLRREIKQHLCDASVKVNDAMIRQALIDRFGAPGTKKVPGVTYGLRKDMWAAFAGAVYVADGFRE